MRARAHGFKGHFGWHTYVVYHELVIEITDLETLSVQGAHDIQRLTHRQLGYSERGLYVSKRPPGQLWFGNKPQVVVGFTTDEDLTAVAHEYPFLNAKFNLASRNCATFTGWLAKRLGVKIPYMIGARRGI